MTLAVVLMLAVGLSLIALSVPLVRRRIKPNSLYGLRVPATFADDRVWYEANAQSGRDMLFLGIGFCLLALAVPLVPGMTTARYLTVLAGLMVAGLLVVAVLGWSRANRLLRERRKETDASGRPAGPSA